jgi:hypothetical protein
MSMAAHFFYLRFFFKARQFWLVVSSSPTLVALSLRRLATSAHTLTRHFGPPGTAAQALAPYRPDLTTYDCCSVQIIFHCNVATKINELIGDHLLKSTSMNCRVQ